MPGNGDIRIDLLLRPLLLVITLIGLLRFAAIKKLSAAIK